MKDYLLKVSIRNNRILRRIEALGYDALKPFCADHKLNYSEVADIIRMTKPVKRKNGEWIASVQNLAGALSCNPDDLFNDKQIVGFKTTSTKREVNENELPLLQSYEADSMRSLPAPEPSPEATTEQKELVKLALEAMDERQRDMITKRYGLDGGGEYTLDEIAQEYPGRCDDGHLSRERIRGIECQALRKARRRLKFDHKVRGLFVEPPERKYMPGDPLPEKVKLVVPAEEAAKEGFSWDD